MNPHKLHNACMSILETFVDNIDYLRSRVLIKYVLKRMDYGSCFSLKIKEKIKNASGHKRWRTVQVLYLIIRKDSHVVNFENLLEEVKYFAHDLYVTW